MLLVNFDHVLDNQCFAPMETCLSSWLQINQEKFKKICSLHTNRVSRATTVHQCTGEPRYFLSRYEYQYLNGISLYRKTTKHFSSKIKNSLPTFRNYCFNQFYDSLLKYKPFLARGISIASCASNHIFFMMAAQKHA